jgi:DNA-directed RNA polymerase beta' subunit
MPINHDVVEMLEERIEEAIAEALRSLRAKKLPIKPGREIVHLMAKGAVTVYEAAVECTGRD